MTAVRLRKRTNQRLMGIGYLLVELQAENEQNYATIKTLREQNEKSARIIDAYLTDGRRLIEAHEQNLATIKSLRDDLKQCKKTIMLDNVISGMERSVANDAAENSRLRAALEKYADHSNWEVANANLPFRYEDKLIQYPDANGWQIAEEALKGGGAE